MSKIKFKNSGKLLKDYVRHRNHKEKLSSTVKMPIGINLPLRPKSSLNEGLFEMTYDVKSQVKVNLKNLILTRRGEYLCMPDFGTDLIDLYNSTEVEDVEERAMNSMQTAVLKYMPFVLLENFTSQKFLETQNTPAYFELKVEYSINIIGEKSHLLLKILTSR
jgi:phage baseplate assembly protein W